MLGQGVPAGSFICMEAIGVAEVSAAAEQLLAEGRPERWPAAFITAAWFVRSGWRAVP